MPAKPKVPAGIQPEEDGKLQCLECGRWYGQLGQHVVARHRVSADDYRRRYGLAASRGLHAAAIRQRRAELGRQLWQQDPAALRARLTPKRTTAAERLARSKAARRQTASRPAVRSAFSANGRAAHQAWLRTVDDRLGERAVAAGFHDLNSMLAATNGLPADDVAALLGISKHQVYGVRRRCGYVSTGGGRPPGVGADDAVQCLECGRFYRGLGQHVALRHGLPMAAYRARHPLSAAKLQESAGQRPVDPRRKSLTAAQLAEIPAGTQPQDHGRLLCLECGGWYRGLAQHLTAGHRIDTAGYRDKHGLPAAIALIPDEVKQARAVLTSERAQRDRRAKRSRAEQVEHNRQQRQLLYDQRARHAGYTDLHHLLSATTDLTAAQVAKLIERSATQVQRLRRAHGAAWTPPATVALPPASAQELADLPPGSQPERDGQLLCLTCGRWCRGLGQHVIGAHALTAAQYRARHQLPAGLSLQPADLRARKAELGRQRFPRIRDAMLAAQNDPVKKAQWAAKSAAARAESRQRAGGRLATERTKQTLRQLRQTEAAARHAAKARELGYDTFTDLIHATTRLPGWRLAEMLGMSSGSAYRLRQQVTAANRRPPIDVHQQNPGIE